MIGAGSQAKHFYPRPLRGGRQNAEYIGPLRVIFLSTPSARRATADVVIFYRNRNDFYPRPLRGGRRRLPKFYHEKRFISIHALCEEGDLGNTAALSVTSIFLSTPSARRATQGGASTPTGAHDFYPRPLRGGRPGQHSGVECNQHISIHALCEEGDSKNRDKISIFKQIIQHSARI